MVLATSIVGLSAVDHFNMTDKGWLKTPVFHLFSSLSFYGAVSSSFPGVCLIFLSIYQFILL